MVMASCETLGDLLRIALEKRGSFPKWIIGYWRKISNCTEYARRGIWMEYLLAFNIRQFPSLF